MSTRLGKYFMAEEFCQSEWARRHKVVINPTEQVLHNLADLVLNILDPLREEVGPIHILSGYRPPKVNYGVGGAKTSQHVYGQAADIRCNRISAAELFDTILRMRLPFDQVIEEFGQWVHVSYGPRDRGQALLARKVRGRTVYSPV